MCRLTDSKQRGEGQPDGLAGFKRPGFLDAFDLERHQNEN